MAYNIATPTSELLPIIAWGRKHKQHAKGAIGPPKDMAAQPSPTSLLMPFRRADSGGPTRKPPQIAPADM